MSYDNTAEAWSISYQHDQYNGKHKMSTNKNLCPYQREKQNKTYRHHKLKGISVHPYGWLVLLYHFEPVL